MFFAKYQGRRFAITAGHCISEANGNDIIIGKDGHVLSLYGKYTTKHPDVDLAVLEIAQDVSEEKLKNYDWLNFDWLFREDGSNFKTNDEVVIPGFPAELNGVDFEGLKIQNAAYTQYGTITEVKNNGLYMATISTVSEVKSTDGMSGAPVIVMVKRNGGKRYYSFLGVNVNGDGWSTGQTKTIIGHHIVKGFLDKIIERNIIEKL